MTAFKHVQRMGAIGSLAGIALFATVTHAAPITWQVQASFNSSGPDSVRGIALSGDGSQEYLGFLNGASGADRSIQEYSTANTYGSPGAGIVAGTGATQSINIEPAQPKGVAIDDRGNVYSTLNNTTSSVNQTFGVFTGSLASEGTASVPMASADGTKGQLGGVAVEDVSGTYYAYVTANKGSDVIARYNVTNPAAPTLDTSWANNGVLDVARAFGLSTANGNVALNGLAIGSDGTLYVAASAINPNVNFGDSVLKISANGGSLLDNVAVTGAMGVALYGGDAYVTDYNGGASSITVLNESDLSVDAGATSAVDSGLSALNLGTMAAGSDSGFAGIAINSTGQLFVTDDFFGGAGSDSDQVLVSSAVPEPASLSLIGIGALALLRRRRRA